MKLLDTNVVVYALGGPHRYRAPCRRLFADIARGIADYTINVELLQEVLHVFSAGARRETALEVFDRLLRVFPEPIPVGREELLAARALLERYPGLSSRDAVHLGVVLASGLEGIVTTDRDLAQVQEVWSFDPADLYGD